jgi:DNA-binding NtrC family response regulator
MAGYTDQTAPVMQKRMIEEAAAIPGVESVGFLLAGFQGQGALQLQQLRHVIRSLEGTRVVVMIPEALESYDELLRQAGVCQVVSRELPPRQVAQFVIDQGVILGLERQNYHLRQMLDSRVVYGNMIGGSPPMRALYRLLDQIARTDAPVLVTGEDGTERVEVARAIHQKSGRSAAPIVAIDCGEGSHDPGGDFLFGAPGNGRHSAGPSRGSAFARAGKGTLVLHRIEMLGMETQRRLLDFMHHPFFQNETPGSPQPLARLVATAGVNLLGKVESGQFLRELFYRLNILQVRVPALRERREDIPMLAQHFLRSADRKSGRAAASYAFSSRAMLTLFQYDWPGNLEELDRIVREVATTIEGVQIEDDDLPEAIRKAGEPPEELRPSNYLNVSLREAKRIFETDYFSSLLKRTQGNMTLASRLSRVGRPYLYKKIREYGLMPEEFR